jgi:hypothetical protein
MIPQAVLTKLERYSRLIQACKIKLDAKRNSIGETEAAASRIASIQDRINAICQEYGISWDASALLIEEKKERVIRRDVIIGDASLNHNPEWRRYLVNGLARALSCSIVILLDDFVVAVLGRKSQVDLVEYLFAFLSRYLREQADKDWVSHEQEYKHRKSLWRQLNPGLRYPKNRPRYSEYVDSWMQGAIDVIIRRILEDRYQVEESNDQIRSLVLSDRQDIEDLMTEEFPSTVTVNLKKSKGLGYRVGEIEGHRTPLRKPFVDTQDAPRLLEERTKENE